MSSGAVYGLVAHEERLSLAAVLLDGAETHLASGPTPSHSGVGISIEPDVCSFSENPLRGNSWSLFVSSFPYHILLAGEGRGRVGSAGWVRSEADGKMVFVKGLRQPAVGCAEGTEDKKCRERKQRFLQAILSTVSKLFTSYFDTWSNKKQGPWTSL